MSAACGPAAESTATAVTQPTATTAPVQPTATTAVARSTATTGETKVRPVPVLEVPAANPNAQKGGIFRFLSSQDPANFGIWDSANGNTLTPSVPVHDTLLDRNEYVTGKAEQILPNLAYDWWTDAKGTTWTFKLKEGVKFSDGQEFTCADVAFSLATIRDTQDPSGKTMIASPRSDYIKRVKNVACPDKNTAVITTDGPLASLPATLTLSTFSVLPKHHFQGNLDWNKNPGIGMGPYIFEKYVPTEMITYKRNPGYWNQPYPYLDGYVVQNQGSATAVESAFRVGRAEKASITKATADTMISQGKAYIGSNNLGVGDGFNALQVNWQKAPWSDRRFSLALRCAIDSDKIIKTALPEGNGWEGPIFPLASDPNGSAWAITKDQWKGLRPCYGPPRETDMEQRRQVARDLLAQLGFTAGNPAKVQAIWPNTQTNKDQWTVITGDLAAVGIQSTATFLATADIYPKFTAGEFDLGTPAGFETSRRDPDHWLYEHYSSTSNRNYGKYVNAEVDAMIAAQSMELHPAERKALLNQIEIQLLKDNAKIVLNHRYLPQFFASWVMDMNWGRPANTQNTSAKLVRVWIDQAKMKQVSGQ